MADILRSVLNQLSNYIQEYKVLSGEELRGKISEEIDILAEQDRFELQSILGGDPKEIIFDGIVGEETGLSVFCPDLHVRHNYLGEIFFAPPTHKYPAEELHKSFVRLAELRGRTLMAQLEKHLSQFMTQLGYQLSPVSEPISGPYQQWGCQKGQYRLILYIFPSIVTVLDSLDKIVPDKEEQVIVVPSEKTPAPFINFLREAENKVKAKNLLVWVVDPENRSINPFMGTPNDPQIWQHFTDPQHFIQAQQIWRGSDQFRSLD